MRFGRYELSERVSEGPLTEAFSVTPLDDPSGVTSLVLTRVHERFLRKQRILDLFRSNSENAAALAHDAILPIVDHGVVDGIPFAVADHGEAISAAVLIDRCRSTNLEISIAECTFILRQVLFGLEHIHDASDEAGQALHLIHGDVSPEQVLIERSGAVRLNPIGAANLSHHNLRASATKDDRASLCVAPEQVLGLAFDHRADLFNAGVLLGELLILRPLFKGAGHLSKLLAIRDVKIEPVDTLRRIPPRFHQALMCALSKSPADRYGSAGEMREAFEPFFGVLTVEELQLQLAEILSEIWDMSANEPDHSASVRSVPLPLSRPSSVLPPSEDDEPDPFFDGDSIDIDLEVDWDAVTDQDDGLTPVPVPSSGDQDIDKPTPPPDDSWDDVVRSFSEGNDVDEQVTPRPDTNSWWPQPDESDEIKARSQQETAIGSYQGLDWKLEEKTPSRGREPLAVTDDGSWSSIDEHSPTPRPVANNEDEPASIEISVEPSDQGAPLGQPPRDDFASPFDQIPDAEDDSFWEEASPRAGASAAAGVDGASTQTVFLAAVTFRRADGSTVGPLDFPSALDKVYVGEFEQTDEASIDGSRFRQLRELPEFSPYISDRPSQLPPPPGTGVVHSVGSDGKGPSPVRQGSIDVEPPTRILYELVVERASGVVVFEHGPIRKDVVFKRGTPVQVLSNMASESLGEHLIRAGVLKRMEVEMALAMQERFDNDLERAMVGLGLIEEGALKQYRTSRLRETLLDVLSWSKGMFRRYQDVSAGEGTNASGVDALDLLWEGIERKVSPDGARAWVLKHKRATVEPSPALPRFLAEGPLPQDAEAMLGSIDTTVPIGSLLKRFGGNVEDAYAASLAVILATELGLLEIKGLSL